jgi:hypothetical protein
MKPAGKYKPTTKELAAEFIAAIDHALAGQGLTVDDFNMDDPHERARLIKTVYTKYPNVQVEVLALALDVKTPELLHAVRSVPGTLSSKMAGELAATFCKAEGVAKTHMLTEDAATRLYHMLIENGFCTETVRGLLVGCAVIKRGQRFPVTAAGVYDIVSEAFGVTHAEVSGSGRHPKVIAVRRLTAYLCRHLTWASFPEIAMMLGKKSHSTFVEQYFIVQDLLEHSGKCPEFEHIKNATYRDVVLYFEAKIAKRYGGINDSKRTDQQSRTDSADQPANQPGKGQSRHGGPEGQGTSQQPDSTVPRLADRTAAA